ncbi:MAG: hypothetical protein J6331_08790 [Lentisphaeria bacterium]|nr:hypothetical protein [Lentisphaeria bacterium]
MRLIDARRETRLPRETIPLFAGFSQQYEVLRIAFFLPSAYNNSPGRFSMTKTVPGGFGEQLPEERIFYAQEREKL